MNPTVEMLPNYRRASERWPDASTLTGYYAAISSAAAGNNHGLVEHVKSFIECLCITILTEFGLPVPPDPSTTELLVAALKSLGLQNTRGANKLDKVLSAFNKLSDALSDMRNETGPVAHGKDAFLDALGADHTRVFLYTGDAIVGVLLNALEGKEPNFLVTREPYERFKHLCDRIDRSVRIKAGVEVEGEGSVLVVSLNLGGMEEAVELRIEPSRLLYGLDRIAFVDLLSEAPTKPQEPAAPEKTATPAATVVIPPAVEAKPEPIVFPAVVEVKPEPAAVVPKVYEGELGKLRPSLKILLAAEGQPAGDVDNLVNAILTLAEQNIGIDWEIRESIQAAMRVAFRRELQRSGFDAEKAGKTAEQLVDWFRIQAPSNKAEAQITP